VREIYGGYQNLAYMCGKLKNSYNEHQTGSYIQITQFILEVTGQKTYVMLDLLRRERERERE
jgi:hypothetical protein